MPKVAYAFPEDDVLIDQLMKELQKIDKHREELAKRLRQLIYKVETR